MNEELLKEKQRVFEALLQRKKEELSKISKYQQDQLESINEADLDQSEMIENQRENMMREMRTESESLDHLKQEVNYLEDYRSFRERNEIGPSTLVKTNIGNFVVAVPEQLFEVEGNEYTGISTKSPLYGALERKKEGDKVSFNDQEIEIKVVA